MGGLCFITIVCSHVSQEFSTCFKNNIDICTNVHDIVAVEGQKSHVCIKAAGPLKKERSISPGGCNDIVIIVRLKVIDSCYIIRV